jgi:hypothetical protein
MVRDYTLISIAGARRARCFATTRRFSMGMESSSAAHLVLKSKTHIVDNSLFAITGILILQARRPRMHRHRGFD